MALVHLGHAIDVNHRIQDSVHDGLCLHIPASELVFGAMHLAGCEVQ